MEPFKQLTGIVAPLEALNADTDQIIPKQFLKRIERTGFGEFLFYDWIRDGEIEVEQNPVLVAGPNFGSGSSREHAVWALADYGFEAVIAPSFSDIFYNNCFNNCMLPVVLPGDVVETLFGEVRAAEGYALTVDLEAQEITKPDGAVLFFTLHPFLRERLLNGWDQIGLTLLHEDKITAYEAARARSPR